jgi:hypothetical protein
MMPLVCTLRTFNGGVHVFVGVKQRVAVIQQFFGLCVVRINIVARCNTLNNFLDLKSGSTSY